MSGTWRPLANPPPFAASTMLLLTDGTIMCQQEGGVNWWRLTPDQSGGYVNGRWKALAPMHHTRLYYASAVLQDGRVFVAGGEYSDAGSETNTAEIYDPLLDSWTEISGPPGWARVGDAPCCVLPGGHVLLGSIDDQRTAIYDPVANTWSAGPNKNDRSSEETWTLLPDHTVLAVECANHPQAEKYVGASQAWVSAGTVPVDLVESSSIEIGPAFLLPDGRVFCIGATPHTAIYTPPAVATDPGSWVRGPDFPPDPSGRPLGAKDSPGCLLPNGRVLCVAGPVDGVSNDYLTPTYFFEFDGTSLVRVTDPPNSGGPPYEGRMMLLPTGHVMFAAGSAAIYVYEPAGGPDPAWAPHITAAPSTIRPSHSYTLHGRQLNGRSQAVGYGDDAAAATNYPLVRLHNRATGRVVYCRTFDHSTMGVATGSAVESTNFAVPAGVPHGRWDLQVVANGIASASVTVTVGATRTPVPLDADTWGLVVASLAEQPLRALGPNGPVPVDAWGASMARRAAGARADVLAGLRTLMVLGEDAAGRRASEAEQRPPAVDADAAQSADRPAEAPAGKSARGAAKGRTRKARTSAPALV